MGLPQRSYAAIPEQVDKSLESGAPPLSPAATPAYTATVRNGTVRIASAVLLLTIAIAAAGAGAARAQGADGAQPPSTVTTPGIAPPGKANTANPATGNAAGYHIHAGDQLAIAVFGEQSLTQTVTVAPNGTIAYPLIGDVQVGGKTTAQTAGDLRVALSKYVRNPQVSVAITSEGNDDVLVLGNVKTPGKYTLPGNSELTDAIAAAGGLGPTNGAFPVARVATSRDHIVDVPLQKLLREGNLSLNVPLGTHTVVYIPGPTPITVQVLGAVDKPGNVEVSEGDRLSIAIAKAGNSTTAHADLSNVKVTSELADGKTATSTYDLYKELNGGDLTADPVLKKGDVVFVPQAKNTNHDNFWSTLLYTFGHALIP